MLAQALAATERAANQLWTDHNTAILAGATGDHLAEAASVARQNVRQALVLAQ